MKTSQEGSPREGQQRALTTQANSKEAAPRPSHREAEIFQRALLLQPGSLAITLSAPLLTKKPKEQRKSLKISVYFSGDFENRMASKKLPISNS